MENKDFKLKSWAAGFLDGEGCFSISLKKYVKRNTYYYRPELQVEVRDDDFWAISSLIEAFGCGKQYFRKAKIATKTRGNSKPTISATWKTSFEIKKVIEVLDEFPLRGKKRFDYLIWRKAVLIKLGSLPEYKKKKALELLRDKCQKVKKYNATRQVGKLSLIIN